MKQPWLWIFLIIAGCTDNDRVPSGIINRPEMEKIMWDMIRVDRYANIFLKDTATKQQKTFELYQNVFSIHHISKDDFIKSYKFYLGRPDLAKAMFDSVSARAERQRSEIYKVSPKDSLGREKDSTANRYRRLLRDSARKRGDSLYNRPGLLRYVRDSIQRRKDSVLKVQSNARTKSDAIRRNLSQPRKDTTKLK